MMKTVSIYVALILRLPEEYYARGISFHSHTENAKASFFLHSSLETWIVKYLACSYTANEWQRLMQTKCVWFQSL